MLFSCLNFAFNIFIKSIDRIVCCGGASSSARARHFCWCFSPHMRPAEFNNHLHERADHVPTHARFLARFRKVFCCCESSGGVTEHCLTSCQACIITPDPSESPLRKRLALHSEATCSSPSIFRTASSIILVKFHPTHFDGTGCLVSIFLSYLLDVTSVWNIFSSFNRWDFVILVGEPESL